MTDDRLMNKALVSFFLFFVALPELASVVLNYLAE